MKFTDSDNEKSTKSFLGYASLGQLYEYADEKQISSDDKITRRRASLAFFTICKSPVLGEGGVIRADVEAGEYDETMQREVLLDLDLLNTALKDEKKLITCTKGLGVTSLALLKDFVEDRRTVIDNLDRQAS